MKIIAFIGFLIIFFTLFIHNDGNFRINNERVGVFFLKNGYHAYWIRYSEGLKYPYHIWKDNLWCMPRFEKCDVRNLR